MQAKKSWMQRVNPSLKLLTIIVLFWPLLFIQAWEKMLIIFLLSALFFLFFSGLPSKAYLWLIPLMAFLFLSTATPMILYGKGTEIWWQWAWMKVSAESFNQGLMMGLRTWSLLLWSLLFTVTTKPVMLFYSLIQQWFLPPRYAYAFLAVFNLLPQLKTILHQRRLVEKMVQRKRSLWNKLIFYSLPLLAQAIRKAFLTAIAMEAKGFSAQGKRTYYYQLSYSWLDLWYLSSILILILLYLLISYWT